MTKVNTNSLYFRQAANMLGEKEALRHLQIVADECDNDFSEADDETDLLIHLFTFRETPQGHEFWWLINEAYHNDTL